MIKKGDRVIMNDKYYVSEKNKGKEFIVTTEPTEVCGTLSVWLDGFRGCYAVDGLTKVNQNLKVKKTWHGTHFINGIKIGAEQDTLI